MLEGEISTLKRDGKANADKAQSHDALVARVQELEAEGKAAEKRHTEDLALIAKGFTDVELLRFEHGRAADAPKTPTEWVDALLAGKRDEAPSWAQPFLPEGGGDDEEEAVDPKNPRAPRNAKVKDPRPGATGELTQDQLREVYQECERTGDWTRWKEVRGMSTS